MVEATGPWTSPNSAAPAMAIPRFPSGIPVNHQCRHVVRAQAVDACHPVDGVSEDKLVPEALIQQRFGRDKRRSTHAQIVKVLRFRTEDLGAHTGMDAISANEDICGERHARRTLDGDPHAGLIIPHLGYRRPLTDAHPPGATSFSAAEGWRAANPSKPSHKEPSGHSNQAIPASPG